jgi:hypothetical protein
VTSWSGGWRWARFGWWAAFPEAWQHMQPVVLMCIHAASAEPSPCRHVGDQHRCQGLRCRHCTVVRRRQQGGEQRLVIVMVEVWLVGSAARGMAAHAQVEVVCTCSQCRALAVQPSGPPALLQRALYADTVQTMWCGFKPCTILAACSL